MGIMKNIVFALAIFFHFQFVQAVPTTALSAQGQYDKYRLQAYQNQKAILVKRWTGCTWNNVIVRKEWSTIPLKDRIAYNNAVLCLKTKAPITPKSVVPGARSRYDDFQATHINQTLWIHWSSYFLPWHRYFTHTYEKALRDECGYKGAQPYWDWSANGATPGTNALFSGGLGSIGSNGQAIVHNASTLTIPTTPPTVNIIDPGTGGGCVLDGPFTHTTDNLGPFGPPQVNTSFAYNPRCITRDFRPDFTSTTLQYQNISDLIGQQNLTAFQNLLQGKTGVHAGGHRGLGGLQDDLYASNGDPAFYFHHASIDHMWTIWQGLDLTNRISQVTGTLTVRDSPPSANGTLDLAMDLGYNGRSYTWRQLASTIDGPFCYTYE